MEVPDDFTFYSDVKDLLELGAPPGSPPPEAPPDDAMPSLPRTIRVNVGEGDMNRQTVTARALACSCFRRRCASVTCRTTSKGGAGPPVADDAIPWPSDVSLLTDGQAPLEGESTNAKIARSTEQLLDLLWKGLRMDASPRPLTGLIVIAGRTGSGKSVIARALIRRYLEGAIAESRLKRGRRPHLLTYEDPVEKWLFASPAKAADHGLDYTPREKGIDVPSLREATRDALRQTPTLFFVGETRDEKDWKELLRFAGTGHLTITTGHAGSLVETMAQILHAARAHTPAERSRVAGRIAALVHIQPHSHTGEKVLIPAFWFQSPRAITTFTAEGLGSLLPNRPAGDSPPGGSYGRAYAVQKLAYLREIDGLLKTALEWDLRGH